MFLLAWFLSISSSKAFQQKDTVNLSLGWYPQFQFAGFYAALNKGYYEEHGIIVNIKTAAEIKSSVKAVLSGPAQYGVGTGSMLLGNANVDKLVVLAAYQQQSPVVLVCLDNNRFERLKDFDGAYIHGGTETRAMFMSAGVEPDSIGPPSDIPDIIHVQNGEYDGMTMYITDLPVLKTMSDYAYKIFKPIDYGINFYGESLFTSDLEAGKFPERVNAMIEATNKGWVYALEHKEELAELLVEEYGSKFTKEQLLEEASIVEESLIIPSLYEIGSMQKTKWADMTKALSTLGITSKPVDLDKFIYERNEDSWAPIIRIILIVLSFMTGTLVIGAITLIFFNRRLRREVSKRTNELKNTLSKLNNSLEKEKHVTDNLEKLVNDRTKIIEKQKRKLQEINSELENRVRSRTKNLQRTNKELDMFIYSMSHDIRAPLASIQGLINVIEIHPEKKDEYLELIEQNVKQLDFFIEEILEYTRNTKRSLNNEIIDLAALVTSIFDQLKYIPGHERVVPIIQVDEDICLVSDKTRLQVILRNLISNAIKYQDMSKEDSYVKVEARSEGEKVIIAIEDNGIGIAKEHTEKVYEMFFRASENSKGSGLGLYVVREILGTMNASINLHSEPQKGTVFTLELINQQIPEEIK